MYIEIYRWTPPTDRNPAGRYEHIHSERCPGGAWEWLETSGLRGDPGDPQGTRYCIYYDGRIIQEDDPVRGMNAGNALPIPRQDTPQVRNPYRRGRSLLSPEVFYEVDELLDDVLE